MSFYKLCVCLSVCLSIPQTRAQVRAVANTGLDMVPLASRVVIQQSTRSMLRPVALCISGLVRSLVYPDVRHNIQWALVTPMGINVDGFAALTLGFYLTKKERASLGSAMHHVWAQLRVRQFTFYHHNATKLAPCGFPGTRPVAQALGLREVFALVRHEELRRGGTYTWVLRARPDCVYLLQLPPLGLWPDAPAAPTAFVRSNVRNSSGEEWQWAQSPRVNDKAALMTRTAALAYFELHWHTWQGCSFGAVFHQDPESYLGSVLRNSGLILQEASLGELFVPALRSGLTWSSVHALLSYLNWSTEHNYASKLHAQPPCSAVRACQTGKCVRMRAVCIALAASYNHLNASDLTWLSRTGIVSAEDEQEIPSLLQRGTRGLVAGRLADMWCVMTLGGNCASRLLFGRAAHLPLSVCCAESSAALLSNSSFYCLQRRIDYYMKKAPASTRNAASKFKTPLCSALHSDALGTATPTDRLPP